MLSRGLADLGLAFELVPVIDRACPDRGARAPATYREGRMHHVPLIPLYQVPLMYLYTRRRTLSVFAGEAGFMVAPNT